jgi:hypothetical protein
MAANPGRNHVEKICMNGEKNLQLVGAYREEWLLITGVWVTKAKFFVSEE